MRHLHGSLSGCLQPVTDRIYYTEQICQCEGHHSSFMKLTKSTHRVLYSILELWMPLKCHWKWWASGRCLIKRRNGNRKTMLLGSFGPQCKKGWKTNYQCKSIISSIYAWSGNVSAPPEDLWALRDPVKMKLLVELNNKITDCGSTDKGMFTMDPDNYRTDYISHQCTMVTEHTPLTYFYNLTFCFL